MGKDFVAVIARKFSNLPQAWTMHHGPDHVKRQLPFRLQKTRPPELILKKPEGKVAVNDWTDFKDDFGKQAVTEGGGGQRWFQ